MSENKKLTEMLKISGEEVCYDEAKERYTFGDGVVTRGMDNWYLLIKSPAHPEIFKVNGWTESEDVMKISVSTSDTKKLLEQLKVLIRYVGSLPALNHIHP